MITHAWSLVKQKGARPNRTSRHVPGERSEQIVKKSRSNAVKRLMPQLALRGLGVENNLLPATVSYGMPSAVMRHVWSLLEVCLDVRVHVVTFEVVDKLEVELVFSTTGRRQLLATVAATLAVAIRTGHAAA